jgi:hypothetical protein
MPDDTKLPALQTQTARPGALDMLTDKPLFEQMQRVARMFSESQLVPAHLRGKLADCFIALHIARRLDEDPLMLMQNIYIVSGKAGWMTQYMIARANKSGLIRGPIRWRSEGQGDTLEVTAFATLAGDGEEISAAASMAMAKAEQWTRNAKYQSMPEHMLRWRSATMLIRLYMPEIMLGLPSSQELEDGGPLLEQPDGSYAPDAPDAPARADFQQPSNEGATLKPADSASRAAEAFHNADADAAAKGQFSKHYDETEKQGGPEPYELVDCDGEAHDYKQAGRWAKALTKVFEEANTRGADVLTGMWETNSPTFGRLRTEERTDLVDDLRATYDRLSAGLGGAATPADARTDAKAPAQPAAADDAQAADDEQPAGQSASGEMF